MMSSFLRNDPCAGRGASCPLVGPLADIASDLCGSLAEADRHHRILAAFRQVVPFDAAAVLRVEGDTLVPLAVWGMADEVPARRFRPTEEPRLAAILGGAGPVRFPPHDPRPDPFDGLLAAPFEGEARIHACMGCAIRGNGKVVGVLTADAVDPRAFDHVDTQVLSAFAALAGAAIHTVSLVDALERKAERQGRLARELLSAGSGPELLDVPGAAGTLRGVRREIDMVAASDLTVLLTGETGVGKEVVARAIHARSRRASAPLVHVNCAALPESIAESELFGHVKGAFSGATQTREGRWEMADGGTLFLDEVGELPLSIQPKLLRALQFGEIQRVGADHPLKADVRVIAATHRELAAEVRAGRFRADLFHRLNVFPLRVPPLRERPEDIEPLSGWFLDQARLRLNCGPIRLTPAARRALASYPWPGNVRELEHVLLRAALRAQPSRTPLAGADGVRIDVAQLGLDPEGPAASASVPSSFGPPSSSGPFSRGEKGGSGIQLEESRDSMDSPPPLPSGEGGEVRNPGHVRPNDLARVPTPPTQEMGAEGLPVLPVPETPFSLSAAVDNFQRCLVQAALDQSQGKLSEAARRLGMDRANLHRLAKRLGVALSGARLGVRSGSSGVRSGSSGGGEPRGGRGGLQP